MIEFLSLFAVLGFQLQRGCLKLPWSTGMILPLEAASMLGNTHEKVFHRVHLKAYRSIRFIDLWSEDYRHPQPITTRKKIDRLWV